MAESPIDDFSLVRGGPFYHFLVRSGLIKPPFGNLGWRMLAAIFLAWLPLIVLTIAGGHFVGGVGMPFLYDLEVQTRLLFVLPLLISAEPTAHYRMRAVNLQFVERNIITQDLRSDFNKAISSVTRLRNSPLAEIAMLIFVVSVGPWFWRESHALPVNTWYATFTDSGLNYTPAGRWYAFVTVPVFQFFLFRWYYRIFLWSRFLFQVSRINLKLVPTHPDRSCGLGFLGDTVVAFAPVLMAHSGLIAGFVANHILHEKARILDYWAELAIIGILLPALVLAPLCVFTPKLIRAKLAGLDTYGRLASEYVGGFADKWLAGAKEAAEPFLGSPDIQSLADLDSTFAIITEIRIVPVGKQIMFTLLLIITVPLTPLLLLKFSPRELFDRLITIVL